MGRPPKLSKARASGDPALPQITPELVAQDVLELCAMVGRVKARVRGLRPVLSATDSIEAARVRLEEAEMHLADLRGLVLSGRVALAGGEPATPMLPIFAVEPTIAEAALAISAEEGDDDEFSIDERKLMEDPAVNAWGIYVNYDKLVIPLKKSWECTAEIRLAQGNDGQWRFGYNLAMPLNKGGIASCAPSVRGDNGEYPAREEAIYAACAYFRGVLSRNGHIKAAAAVAEFSRANGHPTALANAVWPASPPSTNGTHDTGASWESIPIADLEMPPAAKQSYALSFLRTAGDLDRWYQQRMTPEDTQRRFQQPNQEREELIGLVRDALELVRGKKSPSVPEIPAVPSWTQEDLEAAVYHVLHRSRQLTEVWLDLSGKPISDAELGEHVLNAWSRTHANQGDGRPYPGKLKFAWGYIDPDTERPGLWMGTDKMLGPTAVAGDELIGLVRRMFEFSYPPESPRIAQDASATEAPTSEPDAPATAEAGPSPRSYPWQDLPLDLLGQFSVSARAIEVMRECKLKTIADVEKHMKRWRGGRFGDVTYGQVNQGIAALVGRRQVDPHFGEEPPGRRQGQPEPPYGWELMVHKSDGTAETLGRVAKSEAAAKKLAMKVRKAESVQVLGTLTREQYQATYGNRAIAAH